jgi:hypothetical protein
VVSAALSGTTTVTLATPGDTTLKSGTPNQNFGGDTVFRLQASGRNRGVVFFDTSTISQAIGGGTLVGASLGLNIDNTGNNWGSSGATIGVHRLTKATGEYTATWSCAIDVIYNSAADCSGATAWTMWSAQNPSLHPWVEPATATATIHSSQTGAVTLDVTADVAGYLAGTRTNNGWLLKKEDESNSGQIDFKSRERSVGEGPHLVLTIQPAPVLDSGVHDAGFDAGITSTTLYAVSDSHLRQGSPNQNYGTDPVMQIKASGRNRAVVLFDQGSIDSALAGKGLYGATLQFTIVNSHSNWGPDRAIGAHVLKQGFSELGVTWACSADQNPTNSKRRPALHGLIRRVPRRSSRAHRRVSLRSTSRWISPASARVLRPLATPGS